MKFVYKARDWNGKLVKGVVDFHDKGEVISSIKETGLVPISVDEIKQTWFNEFYKNTFSRINLKQISTFTRQLSTMMNSGLPLTDALSLLKNQMTKTSMLYEVIDHALSMVQGGRSLADGLEKYKKYFGEAYIASIDAGEEAGVLDEVMSKLADTLEKQNDFQGKVKGAMIYPVIVVVGMIAVIIIMIIFVIPKLLGLYSDFGSEMPASTKFLMSMSTFFNKFWYIDPNRTTSHTKRLYAIEATSSLQNGLFTCKPTIHLFPISYAVSWIELFHFHPRYIGTFLSLSTFTQLFSPFFGTLRR